ncbi:hypothetical protein AN189_05320 [Loktanella sp. 3ANDIMAR09]|nr:hypothetical protein AN189_05320 [Loktanella sp. 3ANDIMAR09]
MKMLTNRRRILGWAGAALVALAGTTPVVAQTVDLDSLEYDLVQLEPNFVFLFPMDGLVVVGADGPAANPQGLLTEPAHALTLEWQGRRVYIDRVDITFDLFHIDWLLVQSKFDRVDMFENQMFANQQGLEVGRQVISDPVAPGQRLTRYFVIVGNNGYLISPADSSANAFSDLIAGSMTYLGNDAPWGQLTPTQPATFGDFSVMVDRALTVGNGPDGDLIVRNAGSPDDSSVVLRVTDTTRQDDPRQDFVDRLIAEGYTPQDTTREFNRLSMIMTRPDESRYIAYMTVGENGTTVSLVTPSYIDNAPLWLAAHKLYIDATTALEDMP